MSLVEDYIERRFGWFPSENSVKDFYAGCSH